MNLQGSEAPSLAPITAQGSSGPSAIDNVSMTVHREALQLGLRPWRWAWLWLAPVLLGLLYWVLAPGGTAVRVAEMNWSRDIEVERQVQQLDSGWCDEMPPGAHAISRRNVDQPDSLPGSTAAHCRYSVSAWRAVRSLHSEGMAPTPPFWPPVPANALSADAGAGMERLGKRHERYELLLQSDDGRQWSCKLPLPRWQTFSTGQRLRLKVDRFGVADCSHIAAER